MFINYRERQERAQSVGTLPLEYNDRRGVNGDTRNHSLLQRTFGCSQQSGRCFPCSDVTGTMMGENALQVDFPWVITLMLYEEISTVQKDQGRINAF